MAGWRNIPGKLRSIGVGPACTLPPNAAGERLQTSQIVWGVEVNGSVVVRSADDLDGPWQTIPGKLRQIAVAKDADAAGSCAVWGITGRQKIEWLDLTASNPTWHKLPGALTQISLGPLGAWGANASHHVFRYRPDLPPSKPWQHMEGSLAFVAVGTTDVWGFNTEGKVYRGTVSGDAMAWTFVPGSLVHIAVADQLVCGVDSGGDFYYRIGTEPWRLVTDGTAKTFASCATNGRSVWALDREGGVWLWID